jgi:hypothetical protein
MVKFVKIDKARIVITYFEREKAEKWNTDKKIKHKKKFFLPVIAIQIMVDWIFKYTVYIGLNIW